MIHSSAHQHIAKQTSSNRVSRIVIPSPYLQLPPVTEILVSLENAYHCSSFFFPGTKVREAVTLISQMA